MADSPYNGPGAPEYPPVSSQARPPGPLRTSGLAIAGFVCGLLGVFTCCAFVPSVLGIVFGSVSLRPIRRGEQTGAGLAIAAIVLGILGIVFGAAIWAIGVAAPDNVPVPGQEMSESDLRWLRSIGAVNEDEAIQWFLTNGFFSMKENGVVLTDRRVSVYQGSTVQSCELSRGQCHSVDRGTDVVRRVRHPHRDGRRPSAAH